MCKISLSFTGNTDPPPIKREKREIKERESPIKDLRKWKQINRYT